MIGGVTACAASLRSDSFGSDATNDKQLSLASRVSHSGPRSGIPPNVKECPKLPGRQRDPESSMVGRDPRSRQFRDQSCMIGGVTACAASLRSDRFGSDATNDKQLSLASRVSHSGLRSGIPSQCREVVSSPVDEGILNRVQDDRHFDIPDSDPGSLSLLHYPKAAFG